MSAVIPATADAAIDALVLELCWISRRATSSEVMPRGWFAQDVPNCSHLRKSPLMKLAVAFTLVVSSIFRPSVHQLAILPRGAERDRTTTVHLAVSGHGLQFFAAEAAPRIWALRKVSHQSQTSRNMIPVASHRFATRGWVRSLPRTVSR